MSNPQPAIPDEFEDLDFIIIEEQWNEYELQDNSRIKARSILQKIFGNPHDPNGIMCQFVPVIMAIYSTIANRGERNNQPNEAEYGTLPSYEVKILRSHEPWNIYRILKTGQEVRTKHIALKIKRLTDRYNSNGEPFYLLFSGSPSINIEEPKDNLRP